MKSSSLAERLREHEALERLRLRDAPAIRQVAAPGDASATLRKPGSRTRRGGIVARDTGLRLFRVR